MTLKTNSEYIKSSFSVGYFKRYVNFKSDYLELLLSVLCWSSGGVVVKLLTCGAIGSGSIPGLAATMSEIGYFLHTKVNHQTTNKQSSILCCPGAC